MQKCLDNNPENRPTASELDGTFNDWVTEIYHYDGTGDTIFFKTNKSLPKLITGYSQHQNAYYYSKPISCFM